jgi:hypothetical protein
MTLIDCILLTLVNTIVCIALPKVLSMVFTTKAKKVAPLQNSVTSSEPSAEIPSFS